MSKQKLTETQERLAMELESAAKDGQYAYAASALRATAVYVKNLQVTDPIFIRLNKWTSRLRNLVMSFALFTNQRYLRFRS